MCKLLIIALLLNAAQALACQSDYDCRLGSRCIGAQLGMQGICAGGMNPGNGQQAQPSDPGNKTGMQCSGEMQCGIGHTCLKSPYDMYGVCQ